MTDRKHPLHAIRFSERTALDLQIVRVHLHRYRSSPVGPSSSTSA